MAVEVGQGEVCYGKATFGWAVMVSYGKAGNGTGGLERQLRQGTANRVEARSVQVGLVMAVLVRPSMARSVKVRRVMVWQGNVRQLRHVWL